MRNQRYVPILSGIFDLAVVLGLSIFWTPESGGFWWWVRSVPLFLFTYMAFGSLKRGFFASDTVGISPKRIHQFIRNDIIGTPTATAQQKLRTLQSNTAF
jgi:hypothetical protein